MNFAKLPKLLLVCLAVTTLAGCETIGGWFADDEYDPTEPVELTDIDQKPVIKSTTHTDSAAVAVEGYQWQKNYIQGPEWGNGCRAKLWFQNSKTIGFQLIAIAVFTKIETVKLQWVDDG